jgi:hypothetical protein
LCAARGQDGGSVAGEGILPLDGGLCGGNVDALLGQHGRHRALGQRAVHGQVVLQDKCDLPRVRHRRRRAPRGLGRGVDPVDGIGRVLQLAQERLEHLVCLARGAACGDVDGRRRPAQLGNLGVAGLDARGQALGFVGHAVQLAARLRQLRREHLHLVFVVFLHLLQRSLQLKAPPFLHGPSCVLGC